jgi:ribosomal protein S18 acetylase RimI-like enzyme
MGVAKMSAVCRPARPEDLERADALVVRSINDLTERHGFGPMVVPRPPRFQQFSLDDEPDGLWVAEDTGQIVGFAFSWVCGDLWFLAQLFVSPGQQGNGLGSELLKRTLDHAQKAGAAKKALITFAFNRASQGLYIRHGLYPRLPLYLVSVPRDALHDRLKGPQFRCEPLQNSGADLHTLARVDSQVLGVSREKHHRYLIDDDAMRGVAFFVGDNCVGYAYVSRGGHIGPLAAVEPRAMDTAFRTVLAVAAEGGSSKVSAFLPGTSEATLDLAIEHGMRITFPMMLMSSYDFGDWRLYLPRDPGFM